MKLYFIAVISFLTITLFTLFKVFNLPLWGDDFLTIWRYLYSVGGSNPRPEWNHLSYFLTPYGPQDTITGILYQAFGFQAQYFHLASLIFRLGAAVSLIPLVFYLTKSRLSAFFAAVFFVVTVIGFDTTNWVFNMTSYISIGFFNLFVYFFIKARDTNKVKLLLLSGLLFYLTFIWSPIRMTGLPAFVLLIELLYFIQNFGSKTLKKVGLRLTLITCIMIFITISGQSTGPKTDLEQRSLQGISTTLTLLSQGRFDFIFYPILIFGGMFVPDLVIPNFPITAKKIELFKNMILPYFFIFTFIVLFLKANISTLKGKFIYKTISVAVIWSAIVMLIYSENITTFSDPRIIFQLLIGGFILIIAGFLYVEFYKQKNISNAIFYSITWAFISFLTAWFWNPTTIFPTFYRYLIGAAVGISIFLSTLISLGHTTKQRSRLAFLVLFFLIIQIFATRIYLDQLVNIHGKDLSDKIWSQMPYFPAMGKIDPPLLFYFEGDDGRIVHNVLFFNFDYRTALVYNIWNSKIPLAMGDWKSVVSAVTDGKVFAAYGREQKPFPIDNIYAFHLQGTDHLINITDLARNKLKDISQTK